MRSGRWWLGVLLVAAAACGPRGSGTGPPQASPTPRTLATGLDAISIAAEDFPQATGVVRATLLLPREGGTAEFWTVILVGEGELRRFEIQEKRLVRAETIEPGREPTLDGSASVELQRLEVDTPRAEQRVAQLDQIRGKDLVVLLSPLALDLTREDLPDPVAGVPAWEFWVTQREGDTLVMTVWVSAETGEVLASR